MIRLKQLNPVKQLNPGGTFVAAVVLAAALPVATAWGAQQDLVQSQVQSDVQRFKGLLERRHPDDALERLDAARARAALRMRDEFGAAGATDGNVGTLDLPLFGHGDGREFDLKKLGDGLRVKKRGIRLEPGATTDVWAHDGYAYTGTFNSPCGGEEGAGIWVWKKKRLVTVIPSPVGSRSNDVKVAEMNSGDILVHSNESCNGGPGGFEIWNVDKPKNPVLLASVQADDVNAFLRDALGFVDFGVHNLWLFTQGDRDYVAAVVESEFGNFQIFDITDPTAPVIAGFWGSEELRMEELGLDPDTVPDLDGDTFSLILDLDAWLFDGFGASSNRFLHDITLSADGTKAYLSNWDAGLVLLDISDPTDPQLVSVAFDVAEGSLDGEVNSHHAWPSEDGSIVVETEEDFSAWEGSIPPGNLTMDSSVPGDPTIPGTAISTSSGDFFEANPTGLRGTVSGSQVAVDGGSVFDAIEFSTAAGSPTFADTGSLSGELVFIGRACPGDPVLNAASLDPGDIAIVRRGACFFEDKNNTAAAHGAAAVVIANNLTSTPWSGIRIWDYSDPTDPVLASVYNTVCSASTAPSDQCDPRGTYSVHNVVVETVGDGDRDDADGDDEDDNDLRVKAYISWYSDGLLILDVTDPYAPVEVARFNPTGVEFEEQNGGIQDVWGIYKIPGRKDIYASDRNGGLYILKETSKNFEVAGD